MQRLYQFLKSVKLAIVLLVVIALISALSTLIPQNRELAFYYHSYSPVLTWLVLNLGLNSFFSSFLFIASLILFTINLGVCMVDRLVREFTGRRKKRFGPDIVHFGLLVFIVGGIFTFNGRREGFAWLGAGDEVNLPGGYRLELLSFDHLTYEGGRPKAWISTVDVYKDDELVESAFPIEVNRPLSVGNMDVFQTSYDHQAPRVVLRTQDGGELAVHRNEMIDLDSAALVLAAVDRDPDNPGTLAAYFERWQNRQRTGMVKVALGDRVGDAYTAETIEIRSVTGLKAVVDPGFVPALIGLTIAGFGLTLTYARKIGDKEI